MNRTNLMINMNLTNFIYTDLKKEKKYISYTYRKRRTYNKNNIQIINNTIYHRSHQRKSITSYLSAKNPLIGDPMKTPNIYMLW